MSLIGKLTLQIKSALRNSFQTVALVLATTLVLAGCSGGHFGAAKITSIPAGAEVINIDTGTVLGVTPTEVWWESGSSKKQFINVRLRKNGFYDKLATFWLSMRHSSAAEALKNSQKVEVNLLPKPQ